MGKYENELRQIISEGRWSAPNYAALDHALVGLEIALSNMSHLSTGSWSGASGDAARAAYAAAMDDYRALRHDLETVDRIFDAANIVLDIAAQCLGGLPSTVVPQGIHDVVNAAAENGDANVVVQGVSYAVDGAIHAIESLFGNNREKEAKAALASMRTDLQELSDKLPAFDSSIWTGPGKEIPVPDPVSPTPVPVSARYYGGGGGGGLQGFGDYVPGDYGSGGYGSGYDPSVDDGGSGYVPGGSEGSSGFGSSGVGSLALGGGAAAAAGAVRLGTAGGIGGTTGGLSGQVVSGGGLLGARGAGGAGSGSASGTGAGAGGRGAMMAGGGAAGPGKSDRRKGPGLGGPIAPKLEDEADATPQSAGARAGGRRATRPTLDEAPGAS